MITQKPIVKLYKLVMTIYKHVLFSGPQMVVEKFHGVRVNFTLLLHILNILLHIQVADGRFCIGFYIPRFLYHPIRIPIFVHWSVFKQFML